MSRLLLLGLLLLVCAGCASLETVNVSVSFNVQLPQEVTK